MACDGAYVTEGTDFASVDAAWERADDMGSRWYFYPFCFVTTESGLTIKDAPEMLKHLVGWRVKKVKQHFETTSEKNAAVEEFSYAL